MRSPVLAIVAMGQVLVSIPVAQYFYLRVFDDAGNGYFSWVEQALQWVHTNRNAFDNPITAVLCGPVSTAEWGFPSNVRGVAAAPSAYLDFQEQSSPIEEHGFSIVDFERDRIEVKLFKWDVNSQPLSAIDSLEPYYAFAVERP